jgi:hypothetical protein
LDIPLNVTQVMPEHPSDPALNKLQSLGPGSGAVGSYFGDPGEHGGLAKPITAEQRAQWAKEGIAMIDATLKNATKTNISADLQRRRVSYTATARTVLKYWSTVGICRAKPCTRPVRQTFWAVG